MQSESGKSLKLLPPDSDFKDKMHQIVCRLGLRPRHRWGAYSAPQDPLAEFYGPTAKGGKGRAPQLSRYTPSHYIR